MTAHLSDNDIDGYRRNTLTIDRLLDVDSHLAECVECRERAAISDNGWPVFHAIIDEPGAAEHLAYEQIEAYVDGGIDPVDREIVQSHLEFCPACAQEARELTAFRAELSTYPMREYSPATWASVFNRIRSHVRIPAFWIPATTVSAAAASALLVFWMTSRPLQIRLAGSQEEIARLNQTLNQIQSANRDLTQRTASMPDLQRQVERLRTERDRTKNELDQARKSSQVAGLQPVDASVGIARDTRGNLVRVEALPAGIAAALRTGKVTIPDRVARLAGHEGTLMGGSNSFGVIGPRATAVLTDRPTFKWRPAEGATGYLITVYDSAGEEIAHSSITGETHWTPDRPLPRGKQYAWEVVARNGEAEIAKAPAPPSPPARFFVLESAKAAAIDAERARYADSPLILGIRFAEAGLLDDAIAALKIALKKNPHSIPAGSLLANAQSRMKKQN